MNSFYCYITLPRSGFTSIHLGFTEQSPYTYQILLFILWRWWISPFFKIRCNFVLRASITTELRFNRKLRFVIKLRFIHGQVFENRNYLIMYPGSPHSFADISNYVLPTGAYICIDYCWTIPTYYYYCYYYSIL